MDIKIVGVNEQRTKQAEGRLFDVYLSLSSSPPSGWAEFFDSAWHSQFYNMKREAHVEGSHLVVRCVPEEVGQYHKAYLTAAVADANRQFQAEAATAAAASERKRLDHERLRSEALGALAGVRWDDKG